MRWESTAAEGVVSTLAQIVVDPDARNGMRFEYGGIEKAIDAQLDQVEAT